MDNSSSEQASRTGQLILIVGPSGAGKDTLLDGAKKEFASDKRIVFAKRLITRPAQDEDNETISPEDFTYRQSQGLFLLSWQAHGLGYGLSLDLIKELDQGRHVIANLSRSILEQAENLGYKVTVIHITAAAEVLQQRLMLRGREAPQDISGRLNREASLTIKTARLIEIRNEKSPSEGIMALNQAIRQCITSTAPHG
jgi:phosphonate metabolism protein PhnN/1,5-bisphosphokinase (PRPP-forming)